MANSVAVSALSYIRVSGAMTHSSTTVTFDRLLLGRFLCCGDHGYFILSRLDGLACSQHSGESLHISQTDIKSIKMFKNFLLNGGGQTGLKTHDKQALICHEELIMGAHPCHLNGLLSPV